jgi:zinc finger protein-like protein
VLCALQDFLFDSLQSLLASAIAAQGAERAGLIHELVCKVDEVHVTLQKHLRKEEEQLFPLLLSNFSFHEQAELVVRTFASPVSILAHMITTSMLLCEKHMSS